MLVDLSEELGSVSLEIDESKDANSVLIIAHGAGAGMHHPFMVSLASEISKNNLHAVRFNFPYKEAGKKSTGSPKKNIEAWKLIAEYIHAEYPNLPVFLSGKSYGGRMASHVVVENDLPFVKGIVYFGFPLHAPGRDSKDRAQHVSSINQPQLFLQGTKDKLANIDLMREVVKESQNGEMIVLEDADHSFNVPKRTGLTKDDMIGKLAELTIEFTRKMS